MKDKKKTNKGCLIALLVVIGLMFLGVILVSSLMGNLSGPKVAKVTEDSTLVLDFQGPLPYQAQGFWSGSEAGYYSLMESLKSVKDDEKVSGLLIQYRNVPGWQIEEINRLVREIKNTGKKVYAYYDYLDTGALQAAALADEIWIQPSVSSFIDLRGYYYSMPFYKRMLDKLGIRFTVIHMGDYKGTGENFTQQRMSPELRSNLESIVKGAFRRFVREYAEARKMDRNTFEQKILNGDYFLITPQKALELNLVDHVGYESEFLAATGLDKEKFVSLKDYALKNRLPMARDKIALIYAQGTIVMGKSKNSYNPLIGGAQTLGEETFTAMVGKAGKRDDIKGIIVRVDSPGGSALASDIMWASLKEAARSKPVYVSIGGVGASGGYYISAPAHKIYVDSSSIVGSIGVVAMLPNLKELTEKKLGLDYQVIAEGRYSGFGNPFKEVTPDEIQRMKQSMEKTYTEFKTRVAEGRGLSMERVEELAQGKIYLGDEFVSMGMADEIGGLQEAVYGMQQELGIKKAQIVIYPETQSFWERLREGSFMGVRRDEISVSAFVDSLLDEGPVRTQFIYTGLDEVF